MILTEEEPHLHDEDLFHFKRVLEGGFTQYDAAIDQGELPLALEDNADDDEIDCEIYANVDPLYHVSI